MTNETNTTNKTKIKFDHYYVEKRSDNYFGVYDMCGVEITSGTSIWNACKKAKLLETGYNDAREVYCEFSDMIKKIRKIIK